MFMNCIREEEILGVLQSFGSPPPQTLFVHSALSKCGYVIGGPPSFVRALERWGRGGTLVMPTHTYCYPDENGSCEIFDPRITKSRVGSISDYFWKQPGAVRSLHPTHSLATIGPEKKELCASHELCDTPCGRGTPYERLIERDAAVLMFGATMSTYTLFHTAEDAAGVPYLYEPVPLELLARAPSDSIVTVRMWRQDMSVRRRFEEMATWLEERQVLVRRSLGIGELLFLPSSACIHMLLMEEMRKDPYFLVAPEARTTLLNSL
jgi:aminoglycoside 3-N-acetyltransferase